MDSNQPVVNFSFKGAPDPNLTDGYSGYFAVENVFLAGSLYFDQTLELVLRVKHPRSNEIAEEIIGRFAFYIHQYNN
jgi:hypothetical protein